MKVYAEVPPNLSKAMARVTAALKNHAPVKGVTFVNSEEEADLVFLHVIGYPETAEAVQRILDRKKEYAIIQYCLRSTQRPSTRDWLPLWQTAKFVWSYYDLVGACEHDHPSMSTTVSDGGWGFTPVITPLGADPIFAARPIQMVKMYTMLTSGFVAETEGVNEVSAALRSIGGTHFHLGPPDVVPSAQYKGFGISDFQLVDVYARCAWVAGLRRAEGFEMPAAEGLCAGARPICFDAPHYRKWFDKFATFIPEGSFDETVQALVGVFMNGLNIVTEEERREAVKAFDWKRIIPQVWEAAL